MANSRWMGKVSRLTASVLVSAIAAVGFAPAAAAATPSPYPSLSAMLIAPTGPYSESTSSQEDGPMTAADYAGSDSLVLDELKRDGYIQGYVRTWLAQDRKQAIIEEVIAFGGRRDAGQWLNTFKGRSASQYMVRPITADGVDTYFGAHYAQPLQHLYFDLGVFVKGNDFFTVTAFSQADDLGDLETTQAKRQFDAAPAYSISPNQWPENASRSSFSLTRYAVPLAIGGGAVLVVLLLATLMVVVVLTRRRPAPVAAVAPAATEGPLMSEDGRYWWDGQAWRDATKEVPPDAMRSADGYYWWDSRTWRPMPPPAS
jgi:hypothetical protein